MNKMKATKLADEWMLHSDLIPQIVYGPPIDEEFILFRCQNENYIDVKHVLIIALSPRRCQKALNDPFFAKDTSDSRYRILAAQCDSHIHFLSRGLRHGLRKVLNGYEDDDRNVIAECHRSYVGGQLIDEARIQFPYLIQQLKRRHLGALWCMESYRLSERKPEELNIKVGATLRTGIDYIYQLVIASHDGLTPRMKTVAKLTGKRILF